MKWTRQHLLGTVVGLTVLVGVIWSFLPTPIDVDLAPVTRGDLLVTIDHEGKTRVKDRYIVSAPLTGRLLRINLRAGDPVRTRETILGVIEPIDPTLLDARTRAQAEATVEAARATHKKALAQVESARAASTQANRELARGRVLRPSRSIADQEFEALVHAVDSRAAELRAAEFAVQIAAFELEQARAALIHTRPRSPGETEPFRFEIPSPITGVVLRVFQESATVTQPGMRLLEIGDPVDLECEIDVLSTDAVKVKPGQRVLLEHWGGPHTLIGRVRLREPSAFTKVSALGVEEQRVNIIVDLIDPPERRPTLGDGYRVEARIVTWEGRDVLRVPAGALFRQGEGWAVFRQEKGRARLRPVTVGPGNGLEAEVVEGLSEGDSVVLHPSDRVRDGVAIVPRPPIR
ncbi:MAG: HlyD family efflux transporter periplasmic adaptor subunit [Gemmataceae bacterium]